MADIADDTALTLKDACTIFFRDAIKPASLRAEARKGALRLMRIGRTDFVTPAAMREMMRMKECPAESSLHASTSEKTSRSGSSETDRDRYGQAALLATAEALKKRSRHTSAKSTSQPDGKVLQLGSRFTKS